MGRFELTEHQIQDQIVQYLGMRGFYVQRMNSGMIQATNRYGGKHMVRMAKVGTPDILFGLPFRGFVLLAWCEVKRPKQKQTPHQLEFQRDCEERGVLYVLAHNIEDLQKGIDAYLQRLRGLQKTV